MAAAAAWRFFPIRRDGFRFSVRRSGSSADGTAGRTDKERQPIFRNRLMPILPRPARFRVVNESQPRRSRPISRSKGDRFVSGDDICSGVMRVAVSNKSLAAGFDRSASSERLPRLPFLRTSSRRRDPRLLRSLDNLPQGAGDIIDSFFHRKF